MKNFILLTIYFIISHADAQSLDWVWGRSAPTSNSQDANVLCIATDNSSNTYIAGGFSRGNITFGSYTLSCQLALTEAFIVKYASNGQVIWAKSSQGITSN